MTQHILPDAEQLAADEDAIAAWIDEQVAIAAECDVIIAEHRAKRQAEQAQ